MGQIRGKNAHIDACNLRSLSSFGTPAAGQHILVSTDNSAMQNGQGNFDCYIVGNGTTAAMGLELKRIEPTIGVTTGLNIYDGNGSVSGQYVTDAIVPLDPTQTQLVLSTKGKNAAYFYNTFFIDATGTENAATHASQGYSSDEGRMGKLFNIPSGSKYFKFSYRTAYSGGTLVSEVMVTYGTKYYASYYPYQRFYALKNPYLLPYQDGIQMPVYVSPSGNDNNDGSLASPFFTLARAMQENRKIIMRGGFYDYTPANGISLDGLRYGILDISSYGNEEPIIFYGTRLATSASLKSGSTKVYQVSTNTNPNSKWIYQWGIADQKTLISDSARTAYHRERTYRMPYATSIRLTDSVESIEASDDYLYYYDTTNHILYFSCPSAVSSSNFIYCGYAAFFSAGNVVDWEVHIKGVTFIGASLNISNSTNSTLENCKALCVRYSGGIVLNNVKNCKVINCEAAFTDVGAEGSGGDGINCHNYAGKSSDFRLIDCWSHDNNNDGYSDHETTFAIVDGGLYEYNCVGGEGAGLTPAYGSNDVIRNVISQFNMSRGIQYSAYSDSENMGMTISNSVIRNNASRGVSLIGKADVILSNCVVYGNSQGIVGTQFANIKSISTKSVNNTNADQYVDIVVP